MQAGWAFPAGVVRFFRCPKGSRLVGARLGRCGSLAFLGRVWDGTVSEFSFYGRCRIVSKSGCGRFVVQAGWAFPAGRCGFSVARKVRGRGARLGCCGSRAFLGCVGAELFRSFRFMEGAALFQKAVAAISSCRRDGPFLPVGAVFPLPERFAAGGDAFGVLWLACVSRLRRGGTVSEFLPRREEAAARRTLVSARRRYERRIWWRM